MSLTLQGGPKLSLLVLQPTPFCNLDCRYCYLPDRSNTARMSLKTLALALKRVRDAGICGDELSIVWHSGEPLVVPRSWYADAFAIAKATLQHVRVENHFQTNATLVDESWCEFVREHSVRVGVSVDGPEWLHDLSRRTRSGGATHARVMRGIRQLQTADIPLHAICVLTHAHLRFPDEVFDFFAGNRIREVGFNVEEVDGANSRSSLIDDSVDLFTRFFSRIVDRYREDPNRLSIREIARVAEILLDDGYLGPEGNSQTVPFGMLSIAWDGGIGTFSPELLGTSHERFGRFCFGNIVRDDLGEVAQDPRLRLVSAEIRAGVESCRASCAHFQFCGGGAPSNKLGETGRFDCTTTRFCQLTQKAVVNVVLSALERDLGMARTKAAPAAESDARAR